MSSWMLLRQLREYYWDSNNFTDAPRIGLPRRLSPQSTEKLVNVCKVLLIDRRTYRFPPQCIRPLFLVRTPGFEPGLSAWRAYTPLRLDVLDQVVPMESLDDVRTLSDSRALV